MSEFLEAMGRRILVRRKQLRLTQEVLAEQTGVTPQTISTAELGKKALRPENIVSLCRALDVSTDYLLHGETAGGASSILSDKVDQLTPRQYRYLEEIIDSYIAAVKEPQ